MRGLVPLVVLLAACTTAAGNTTTTAPLVEPSTTSTTESTTTTESPTTTTNECVDRNGDGLLRTRKGFVCPDQFVSLDYRAGSYSLYLPGTYRTAQFVPPLTVTRDERFGSEGESPFVLSLDASEPHPEQMSAQYLVPQTFSARATIAFGGKTAETIARLHELRAVDEIEGQEWATNLTTTQTELGGMSAVRVDFDVQCIDPNVEEDEVPFCSLQFTVPGLDGWREVHGRHTTVIATEVNSHPFAVLVTAFQANFDTYWTETVAPLLDSIEFLDS
jgi:hypothetical protein